MRYFLLSLALVLTSSAALAQGDGKQLITQQWVMSTAEGQLYAAIVAPGLDPETLSEGQFRVALVSQDGAIYRAEPSPASALEFSFVGVPEGVYTLVARGPSLVACYAVHVLDSTGDAVDPRHHLLAIAASNMRINKVRNAVIRYMPSSVPFVAEFDAAAGRTVMDSLIDAQTFRTARSAGGFSGQIYRAGMDGGRMIGAGMTNVMVYQNRELVAQAVTDEEGKFSIETLAPGQYGVIVIGPDGFAVVGFSLVEELVASRQRAEQNDDDGRLVALLDSTTQPEFQLQLSPSGLESPAMDELLQEDNEPAQDLPPEEGLPVDPAEMAESTGSGGGGGGGSGGGDIGPVIGIAAVAAALAASSSDSDSFTTPAVTSPVTP